MQYGVNAHVGSWSLLSLVPWMALAPMGSGQTRSETIAVTDHRPLAAALDQLQALGGITINYEDPPYRSAADLEDVSTPAQRAEVAGYHLMVPRIGTVMATFEVYGSGEMSMNEESAVVEQLLASYKTQGLPGDFVVEQVNGMLYVTPVKIRGADGVARDVTSPMMATIDLQTGERVVAGTIDAILHAASSAGSPAVALLSNVGAWYAQRVVFGASGVTARDALAALFRQLGAQSLCYRLFFDPQMGDYVLNLGPRRRAMAPGPGSVTPPGAPAAPRPSSSPGTAPGFVKASQ